MHTSSHAIAVAAAVTAAFMLFISVILFFLFQKFSFFHHRQRRKFYESFHREAEVNQEDKKKLDGVKGVVVEENGVDIIHMRQSEDRHMRTRFPNSILNPSYEDEDEEEKRIDVMVEKSERFKTRETPLLSDPQYVIAYEDQGKPVAKEASLHSSVSAAILPTRQEVKSTQLPQPLTMILEKKTQPPPSPTPPPPAPPPPPPPRALSSLKKEVLEAPVLSSAPQPPTPKASGLISSLKPPTAPKGKANFNNGDGQTRLKPLHWDKVVTNVDHSTVWDRINDGSFRVDDQLMETLFGYSTNNKSYEGKTLSISSKSNSSPPTQIFILEARKSQNTAIVLKSLAISRKGILEALLDGQGLSADTIEKLTKVAPTQEEEAKIINFDGNPDKLADAESFLYFILKAVPTAFTRLKVMHFRSSYDCEVLQLKEHMQTLELGCKKLRTSGLFLKLLEAILKAGNRMNAGTSRGNAQAFNLTALRKLRDVKSIDGKTSLLHFIVEQVVQSEGRRQATCQNQELRSGTGSDSDSLTQQEQNKDYLLIGLPLLGGLSDELSEVKKAVNIDYQSFINMYSTLNDHLKEIRQIITCCGNNERGGFVREMKEFLEGCEEELKVVKEEQKRIMDLVNKTNEYYQAGVFKDKISDPFQLFAIVKDFLDLVDEVCAELKRKIEKKNVGVEALLTPPVSPTKRVPLKFPNFDLHFLSNASEITSSRHWDDDF